jgi:hypothetical protein
MKHSLLLSFFLVLIVSCTSTLYINQNYNFITEGHPKVVLFPVLENYPFGIDTIFEVMFSDSIMKYEIVKPSVVRNDLNNNSELMEIVIRVFNNRNETNSKDSVQISLKDIIGKEYFQKLHDSYSSTDVFLFPTNFNLRENMGAVVGEVTYYLYDSKTGILIFEKYETINVFPGGQIRTGGLISKSGKGEKISDTSPEAKYCTAILAAVGYETLKENFVEKIGK